MRTAGVSYPYAPSRAVGRMSQAQLGYLSAMRKPLLALFVLGAMAAGLLLILLVGSNEVERDGVENDSIGWSSPRGAAQRQPLTVG